MNDLLTINPYNLLGVNTKSTINELKKAYGRKTKSSNESIDEMD